MQAYWNGEPVKARKVFVRVGEGPPTWWTRGLEGTVRAATEVTYGGGTFLLDDEGDDLGWRKVTEGRGSPRWPSRSLPQTSSVVGVRL